MSTNKMSALSGFPRSSRVDYLVYRVWFPPGCGVVYQSGVVEAICDDISDISPGCSTIALLLLLLIACRLLNGW